MKVRTDLTVPTMPMVTYERGCDQWELRGAVFLICTNRPSCSMSSLTRPTEGGGGAIHPPFQPLPAAGWVTTPGSLFLLEDRMFFGGASRRVYLVAGVYWPWTRVDAVTGSLSIRGEGRYCLSEINGEFTMLVGFFRVTQVGILGGPRNSPLLGVRDA